MDEVTQGVQTEKELDPRTELGHANVWGIGRGIYKEDGEGISGEGGGHPG